MSDVDLPLTFGLQYLNGSHEGPDAPEHCRGCGRVMVLGRRFGRYDAATGTPQFVATVECPNKPSWLSFFWPSMTLHDKAEQDSHGDWPYLR